MKKFVILLISVFAVICANSLVDEEIYYNGDKSEITGKKQYLYDKNKNIVRINIFDANSELQAKLLYTYEDNKLVECEEYNGKTKIKYSKFEYDRNLMIKKTDFDISDMVILVNEYIYDNEKNIIVIEKNFLSGDKFGKTEFTYKDKKPVEEHQYDQTGRVMLSKKYEYNEGRISRIDFFSASGSKVRVIERKYSGPATDENAFGFNANFWDIR
jgi:ssDNA-binding Zn-finger/Zn-ribbon topoisomerase 1